MSASESNLHAVARRVVLLARPGAACEQLRRALQEADARIVLEADPSTVQVQALVEAAPQAILVALDAAVEENLSRLDSVLHDPAIAVIFDEAELAARREGWEAQRWVRHLSAKLHGHDDVLPPGREQDEAYPEPGLPATPAQLHAAAGLQTHLEEAQGIALELPRGGLELAETTLPPLDFSEQTEAWQPPATPREEIPLHDGFGLSFAEEAPSGEEAPARAVPPPLPQAAAPAARLELALEPESWQPPPAAPSITASQALSAPAVPGPPPLPSTSKFELELESLQPNAGAAGARGAVVLFAGIGGPDAVRKVLAELPEDLPRPVLVQLRLDGGRYDNLVKQMERVSALPVFLAKAGDAAQPGQVYILPNDVAVAVNEGAVHFEEGELAVNNLIQALPAKESAVLLLSGSDPAQVEAALVLAGQGGLAAGQSPQGCYDPAAAKALAARGGLVASPSELATRLIEHAFA